MANLLDDNIKKQIKEMFSEMEKPVEIVFFGSQGEACEYCEETLALVKEVVELSDKLSISEHDLAAEAELARQLHVDKAPTMVIATRDGERLVDHGIRYAGIPAGSEFSVLINVLLLVSKGDSGLSEPTRKFLSSLEKPVHLQVFVTPT